MKSFPPLPIASSTELPPIDRAALLLDLDGTLLDLAPTPDTVIVAEGLVDTLRRLRIHLGDALAIVTGRPVAQLDAILPDVAYAVAGEHGAAIRHHPGELLHRAMLPEVPVAWLTEAERLAASHEAVLLERKLHGFVLHYRLAPEAGEGLRTELAALVGDHAEQFELLEASMAWEIRARGIDKGVAVAALMEFAPFAGRLPVFIGDDRTDLDGIRAAQSIGGAGLLVGEVFGNAGGVRQWLTQAAEAAGEP